MDAFSLDRPQFDAYGNSGGCWETYTVIASSIPEPLTCQNVSFAAQLDVAALVDTGNISQYGFIDQCTDISLTPLSGTPPFTLTVAPALHPVYNITSFDMSPINWTVSLNWASPFFISLADSNGALWSNGPLHAGNGPIGCLAGNVTSSHGIIKVPVAIGISFLALFIGALIGGIGIFLFSQRGRHPFQELGGQEPKSFMGRIIAGTMQSEVSPYQLSSREEPGQGHVSRRRDNIKWPTVGTVSDSTAERPPSYPQFSPAESEYITREISFGHSISTATIVTNNSASTGSLTRLEPSERHYNPRGPLNSDRPRSLTNGKGSSVPSAPA
ncbi:hypothetical protein HYPSUDRAFT_722799 [Hypholoma sublateritium FD-334 SS-4]|uniref:Uncharacterized protein n=1 Tax=Hypholoma sublateritium (strain FD-334 SS-4) TaxID=945553 RepID=A0A0D2PCX5_HYPSF|nr:hypothetical protein HYPSUDRAFT_722799 [Hypholoma sublateritium FD-334 SS-4]